jgi:hypothetical protein
MYFQSITLLIFTQCMQTASGDAPATSQLGTGGMRQSVPHTDYSPPYVATLPLSRLLHNANLKYTYCHWISSRCNYLF